MLNPQLQRGSLAENFRRKKRLLIRDVLDADYAASLRVNLVERTPWVLRFSKGGQAGEFSREQYLALTDAQRAQFMRDSAHFDFIHKRVLMASGGVPLPHLDELFQFLNSAPFLNFAREITGLDDIVRTGAMATCFEPGNFLREHDDYQPGEDRLCAYVLNLSQDWRPDWGGLLHFMNRQRDVVESFVPWFNSLSLFAVPTPHLVSMVSPYAQQARVSVTGWLYPDD